MKYNVVNEQVSPPLALVSSVLYGNSGAQEPFFCSSYRNSLQQEMFFCPSAWTGGVFIFNKSQQTNQMSIWRAELTLMFKQFLWWWGQAVWQYLPCTYMARCSYMTQYRSYCVYERDERPMSDVEISAWLGWALGGMIRLVNVFTQPDDHCDEMLSLSLLRLAKTNKQTDEMYQRREERRHAWRPPAEPIYISLIRPRTRCLMSFHTHAGLGSSEQSTEAQFSST